MGARLQPSASSPTEIWTTRFQCEQMRACRGRWPCSALTLTGRERTALCAVAPPRTRCAIRPSPDRSTTPIVASARGNRACCTCAGYAASPRPTSGRETREGLWARNVRREEVGWQAVRRVVLARDGKVCRECEEPADRRELDVHRLVRRADGGRDEASNCITLCDGCRAARHPRLQVALSGRMMRRWALRVAHRLDRSPRAAAGTSAPRPMRGPRGDGQRCSTSGRARQRAPRRSAGRPRRERAAARARREGLRDRTRHRGLQAARRRCAPDARCGCGLAAPRRWQDQPDSLGGGFR